jgi:hypothetical protein
LRLEPTSTGERDDMSAYALRNSDCPVCHPASVSSGPGWPGLSGGVAFPKLSKLLNQEDALSAPCLRELCSPPAAPSRGAAMLRTGVIRHFEVTLPFATPNHHAYRR